MFFPPPPPHDPVPRPPSAVPTANRVPAWRRRHPWRFATWFTMSVFLVVSFVPIWSALYIGPLEITGEQATFWQMIASLWEAVRRPVAGRLEVEHFGTEAVTAAAIIILSVFHGRLFAGTPLFAGKLEPPEAADYDDRLVSS